MKNQLMITAGALLLATFASADNGPSQEKLNKRLQGTYVGEAVATCQGADGGFGPPPQLAALGALHQSTEHGFSTVVFNGDGTFSVEGTTMSIAINPAPQPNPSIAFPITKSKFICQGVYQVNADNTYSADYTCTGNTVSGSAPGTAFTATGFHETGVLKKGKTLSTESDGNIEFVTTQFGTNQRICARNTVSMKTDDDDN